MLKSNAVVGAQVAVNGAMTIGAERIHFIDVPGVIECIEDTSVVVRLRDSGDLIGTELEYCTLLAGNDYEEA